MRPGQRHFPSAALFVLSLLLCAVPISGATPEETLRDAQQLEKNGNSPKAIPLYEQFLKENPTHSQTSEARYRLGKCYDAVGRVEQAISTLKSLTDQPKPAQGNFRNRPDAFYALAKLHASGKQYEQAIAVFERLLGEGAGLHEDEVLSLTGGYYAILGRYEDAAGKFNLLRRKGDAQASESAAYKLAMLWLRAGDPARAICAIQDLATGFPRNDQIPELLLRAADLFRQKKEIDKTLALCEQIRARYPKAPEAAGAAYLLGMCYRDKGEHARAADAFDVLGKARDPAAKPFAAEAVLASAEIYFKDIKDAEKAIARYEEAARLARESEGNRRMEILEQCYFRLAEHQYSRKNFGVALDFYTLLRSTGSRVNVLSRILECQAQLNKTTDALAPETVSEADIEVLKKKIAEKPGSAEAAEAELFLLDRKFAELSRKRGGVGLIALGAEYEKIAATYPKEALAAGAMAPYLWQMAGMCFASGSTREDLNRAMAAFERTIETDPSDQNTYRQPALENLALCAERAGDKARAARAYAQLLEISKRALAAHKDDKVIEGRTLEYLKSLATRADTPDVMDQTIAITRQMIEERGALSDLARESRFYLGELYFLKKDYSAAAATFREFIQVYGPKLDAAGELAAGPWKPAKVDAKIEQVYEAAVRVAHAWAFQGHDQNMVKAYGWLVRNHPVQNKHLAEANYYLAMELLKGKAGESKATRKQAAETLWTTVVNPALPSIDLDDSRFRKGYYFWLADDEARKYVRHAVMKAGQLFSETEDHETAAAAFREYLTLFGGGVNATGRGSKKPGKGERAGEDDDLAKIARYALGREYATLKRASKVIETFKPYLNGHRDDRFRISGLRLMAFQAAQASLASDAVDAYATILDEYGENRLDEKSRPSPVPMRDRLKQGQQSWDGIRIPPPKGLDLGDVRFALGFLYWKNEDFARCAKTLASFLNDPVLRQSKSRPQALFMAGQSQFKLYDDAAGLPFVRTLIKDYPRFEAIEEAFIWTARGMVSAKAWPDLDLLCRGFVSEWPKSDRRPRVDLYAAVAQAGLGKTDAARRSLLQLAKSDTYEDVKADAWYHAGMLAKDPAEALACFESSIAFPREQSLLEAGRAAYQLRELDKARQHLERAAAMKGDPKVLAEAKDLLSKVQKDLTVRDKKK